MVAAHEHASLGADDLGRFVEHHLDETGVPVALGGESLRSRARPDLSEAARASLGLRNDLVRHHENVAPRQVRRRGVGEQGAEVVPRRDLGQGL